MPGGVRWAAIGVKPERLELLCCRGSGIGRRCRIALSQLKRLVLAGFRGTDFLARKYKETPRDRERPCSGRRMAGAQRRVSRSYQRSEPETAWAVLRSQTGRKTICGDSQRRTLCKRSWTMQPPLVRTMLEKVIEGERSRQRNMLPQNRLHAIALAVINYTYDHDEAFPPPFSVDKNGKPLHSWRVLILPYLDEDGLARKIRLSEPWDSEYNRQFHNQMPAVYYNSAYPGSDKKGETNFCMVVGPDSLGRADGKALKTGDIKNGASRHDDARRAGNAGLLDGPDRYRAGKGLLGHQPRPSGHRRQNRRRGFRGLRRRSGKVRRANDAARQTKSILDR